MGSARTKGFGPAFFGTDVENAREDEAIRYKNCNNGHYNANGHNNENNQQIAEGAVAGQLEEGNDVAHIVINDIVSAEGYKL